MRILIIFSIFLTLNSYAGQSFLESNDNAQGEAAYMQLINPSAKNNVIPELKWLAAKLKKAVARSALEYLSWMPVNVSTNENIPSIKYKNYFENVLEKEELEITRIPKRATKRAKAALEYVLSAFNQQVNEDMEKFTQGQDIRNRPLEEYFALKKNALEKNVRRLSEDFYENIINALENQKAMMQRQDKFLIHPIEKRWDNEINIFNLGIADAIKKSGTNVGMDKSWAQLYGIEE